MTQLIKNIQQKVVKALSNQHTICGDCAGFSCEILRGGKLCKYSDILETSKPCNSFTPSIQPLQVDGDETDTSEIKSILDLCSVVMNISDSKLRAVGNLIIQETHTRKAGFNMGEKVYVRYRGRANVNYISNFMSAHIMHAKSGTIRIMSADGKICMTLEKAASKTVYSMEEFEPMREQMMKKGKFADPEVNRALQKSLRCREEYELGLYDTKQADMVTTIDSVFKTNKIRKSSRTGDADLVSIVKAIENLHDANTVDVDRKRKRNRKSNRLNSSVSKSGAQSITI